MNPNLKFKHRRLVVKSATIIIINLIRIKSVGEKYSLSLATSVRDVTLHAFKYHQLDSKIIKKQQMENNKKTKLRRRNNVTICEANYLT